MIYIAHCNSGLKGTTIIPTKNNRIVIYVSAKNIVEAMINAKIKLKNNECFLLPNTYIKIRKIVLMTDEEIIKAMEFIP